MLMTPQEQRLCAQLRDLPKRHDYLYTDAARRELLQILFRSLVGEDDRYLQLFFPRGPPTDADTPWSLSQAQGALEGAEYTEAARGKPCGHIFKSGEATYACKTCAVDDTCVLCSRCFDASDHEDHQVLIRVSPGNSGCCDCGDEEAWTCPVNCNIHTASTATGSKAAGKAKEGSPLPEELLESIRMTIARALDYIIDVFSCSPEQLRLQKSVESIEEDERTSRLTSKWYGSGDLAEENQKFALLLWNDEKHTVIDVQNQVARACKKKVEWGLEKAHEVDEIGRSAVYYSTDIEDLLRRAKIIEDIKLTVTIRSARDTFREMMSGTIVEWIQDIAGCTVGEDTQILRHTVCKELLKPWRVGSPASHQIIGQDGLDDHEKEDREAEMGEFFHHLVNLNQQGLAQQRRRRRRGEGNAVVTDDDEDDQAADGETEADDMDIDELTGTDNDGDVQMEPYESPDEALEVSEATMAGYPPPPPPPQGGRANAQTFTPAESDSETATSATTLSHMEPSMLVPETPRARARTPRPKRAPDHWIEKPESYGKKPGTPIHEDLWQRVRLDHLILYDLRMWKVLRNGLRDVFISTVVSVPEFKRLLALRFTSVYTALAQLYLIADREPDHSIINLSLQMLTTPSITAEIVERGNFLTNLMAILYTFLTTRQVGYPWNIDPTSTLAFDQGAVTNRRLYHFFLDMKYLLGSEFVQAKIREEPRYLQQFLDLVKLHQGICPNVRAVGEHLEYESEAWYSASLITKEMNKLCRQFSEAFAWTRDQDPTAVHLAIRYAAKVAIVNSLGVERKRFDQAELKGETRFKVLDVFEFDADPSTLQGGQYRVVDYIVAKEPMSFHHPLHYILSWLIERARGMPREHLRELLLFSLPQLREKTSLSITFFDAQPDEYMLALFDFPLRVCAWLAQMRANIWVRNGITLRHQMSQYRNVNTRDVCYQRDILLLQTALVLCNPSVFLATMVDRYGLMGWMTGKYEVQEHGFEDTQAIEVVEDFVHLLIILLSDRTHLVPAEDGVDPHVTALRRDIAHALVFKPLSFSDTLNRLSEEVKSAKDFTDVLSEMTTFKPPEGLADSGLFILKEEYIELVDPYAHQYTRNLREEAENIYKSYMAKKTGKPLADIVFEPKLRPIQSGVFENLADFTRQPLFAQIIYYLLGYALRFENVTPDIPSTRIEMYLQFVLQLLLVAILEDKTEPHDWSESAPASFATSVLTKRASGGIENHPTILSILKTLLEKEAFKSCEPKINLILHRLKQRQQDTFIIASEALQLPADRLDTASPASMTMQDKDLKKKQAEEKKARVMASFKKQQNDFMANQTFDWGDEDISDLEDESGSAIETEKIEKYPSGSCIFCQEATNDQRLYGTFGYVSQSRVLRLTDLKDDDWVEEVTQTPTSLDRSAEAIRPFGVAGKNKHPVEKTTATGEKIITERQVLGKGFPTATHTVPGPVSSGCGHIMHYSCFEQYLQSTQRRHISQIARNHPERPDKKEFMCPLCKALGNMFLPVIWKGKKVSYPGAVESESTFDEWIGSKLAVNVSKSAKSPERASGEAAGGLTRQQKGLYDYGAREFVDRLAADLPAFMKPKAREAYVPPPPPSPPPRFQFHIPAIFTGQTENPRDAVVLPPEITSTAPAATDVSPLNDLLKSYVRLRETFKANSIPSSFFYPSNDSHELAHQDCLAKTLGHSITAVEVAHRGVESDTWKGTLIDKISPQSLTHLRIYSETVSSYIALGCLRSHVSSVTLNEYTDLQSQQLRQLFSGHPDLFDPSVLMYELKGILPLLSQDPFIFLSEVAVGLVPALNLDIHHVMRLCYMAEIVRVVLAFVDGTGGMHTDITRGAASSTGKRFDPTHFTNLEKVPNGQLSFEESRSFYDFISTVLNFTSDDAPPSTDIGTIPYLSHIASHSFLNFVYTMASTYALAFVRKAAILMHVRYGVELPHTSHEEPDAPELDRLTSLLKLPTIHQIFSEFGTQSPGGVATRYVVGGWVRHWVWAREGKRTNQSSISLSHPAIYELVGLPKNYDLLTDEAIRRKCPTTGKAITDPAVCLFCGEIFCSQGLCCMKDKNKGGCNQHLARCGGNIGVFINIRKCMVCFINDNNGIWAVAPYLDKHGEVDPTLRRHQQLFLNQKRCDLLLRKVWLEGGIPSLIARRLEGDINNGGWETL